MPHNETPFENQLHHDLEARRAAPTSHTIRIGDSAPPPATLSPASGATTDPLANSSTNSLTTPAGTAVSPRERPPLPLFLGLAMALGALCVIGTGVIIGRFVPATKPFLAVTTPTPIGDTLLINPESVSVAAEDGVTDNSAPIEEPSAKPSEAQHVNPTQAQPIASPATTQPISQPADNKNSAPVEAQPYRESKFELSVPGGFSLSQQGRRTIWKRDDGAQILVEQGKAGSGSPRSGWVHLERSLQKKYGSRFKSRGIRDGEMAGRPASIWEFELTGKDGITRRKIDVAIHHQGRGYAVLVSAPNDKFDAVLPEFHSVLGSFKVNSEKTAKEVPSIAAPTPAPQPRATEVPTPAVAIPTLPAKRRSWPDEKRERPKAPELKLEPPSTPADERGY